MDPGRYLDSDEIDAMFDHRPLPAEGEPRHLPFGLYVVALEALVGDLNGVRQFSGDPTRPGLPVGSFDGLFFDRALPRMPLSLRRILCPQGGRAVAFVGPRFRAAFRQSALRSRQPRLCSLRTRAARPRDPRLPGPRTPRPSRPSAPKNRRRHLARRAAGVGPTSAPPRDLPLRHRLTRALAPR